MSKPELTEKEKEERRQRKINKMNSMQFSPVGSLPITALMLWMAGNDIHMFSIMITGNAIYAPIGALLSTGANFVQFQGDDEVKHDLWRCKLVYALMCLVALLVGLGKLHFMGLLPTSMADWLDHTPPQYTAIARQVLV